jgi:hypothetical protein
VYGEPPVPFPFTKEQVGKSDAYPVPEGIVKGETQPQLEVTLHTGDILYIPRGFVHEAYTTEEDASVHLTIALATHDWAWSAVAAGALSLKGETEETRSTFRADVECTTSSSKDNKWRRSVPPALICHHGCHNVNTQEDARRLAHAMVSSDERLEGLTAKDLASALASRVAVHNKWQDELQSRSVTSLDLDSYVRRLTPAEKEEAAAQKTASGGSGLVAREEISATLMKIIASIETTPRLIREFENAPLLCDLSKVICLLSIPPSSSVYESRILEPYAHVLLICFFSYLPRRYVLQTCA